MIQISKGIKKSRSCAPLVVAFLIIFNYCGLQALSSHAEPDVDLAEGSSYLSGAPHHHEEAGSSGSPEDDNSCCPEMVCCTSLKLTADHKEMASRFVSPPIRKIPRAIVFAWGKQNEPGEQALWVHDNGPPAALVKLPFSILEYPSHAPPSA